MYSVVANTVKGGKIIGEFKMYGYDTPETTGAALEQLPDRAFNPAVPPAVVAELAAYQKKLAAAELKLAPTREDARPGK